jgi:hypothetical protein
MIKYLLMFPEKYDSMTGAGARQYRTQHPQGYDSLDEAKEAQATECWRWSQILKVETVAEFGRLGDPLPGKIKYVVFYVMGGFQSENPGIRAIYDTQESAQKALDMYLKKFPHHVDHYVVKSIPM